MRPSGRRPDELRAVRFTPRYTRHAEGSVLAEFGDTRVLCTASIEPKVPPFLKGKQQGWVTAEYGMLPRATHTRTQREASKGKQAGRTLEIQRLIGRSSALGSRSRGARREHHHGRLRRAPSRRRHANRGDLGRLHRARARRGPLVKARKIPRDPIHGQVAAISAGVYQGVPILDLDYQEDSEARNRHERRDERRRRLRRDPGHGGGSRFAAHGARRTARARGARNRAALIAAQAEILAK